MGTMNPTYWILIIAIGISIAVFAFVLPIAQDPAYHDFADSRRLLGINNFWNVVSNLPFLLIGVAGLLAIQNGRLVPQPGLELAYRVFFVGVALTAFGSGWYHLAPANGPLVWDRLPMTIGFAGMLTIIVGDLVATRAGQRLLLPMLAIGAGSVFYWAQTEILGAGDLRPYALVQFLPMLLIAVILIQRRREPDRTRVYWHMLGWYLLAKVFEHFDRQIYALGELISGHSLKHVAAAMAPVALYLALTRKRSET